ncbi:hypothetical protein D9611_011828 [Ephemerocybe angulata]|uniref:DUF6533 domain-containing protein n=1 Tax=Ephemerocybe angulata TaxID=980116 RepID=A0A8H5FC49_9AGAR|nr:hypothetical protein D9611_011828 [Tulosesus angulatus]
MYMEDRKMSDGFALIESAIRVWHNQGYSKAAVLTLLICDILHNLADEVKYIWRSKWTFVKTMYLLARYYGVALVLAMMIGKILLQFPGCE